ncbi:MAG: hypothetical protein HQL70_09695 [Magnetococcales bacterium]|nr:hypothetical protein [Magnetococcales bacterium]
MSDPTYIPKVYKNGPDEQVIKSGGKITTEDGVGTKNGDTVTVAETAHNFHTTVLTLTATPITLTDDAGVGQYGGVKIYDMPAGNHLFLGAVVDADITLTEAAWADTAEGDIGVGTTAVTDGNALATTEQNIIATTAIAALAAQTGPINAGSADVATIAAAGTTDSDIYLNVRIDDDAAHATGSGTITGTVTLVWANLGDY